MNSTLKSAALKLIDSRQQLVEILGLSGFLRSRIEYLEANSRIGRGSLQASKESTLIKQALSEVSASELGTLKAHANLHANEAGRRISILLKKNAALTHADVAHARGMLQFPDNVDASLASRGAYLRALELLGLASEAELSELKQLNPSQAAANS